VIGLICPRHAKLSQHDRKFDRLLHGSVQGILPIRISYIAFCHAPFLHVLWPIIRLALSQRLRKRVCALAGKDEAVLGEFQAMSLCKEKVPELIGGDLRVNHKAWMEGHRLDGIINKHFTLSSFHSSKGMVHDNSHSTQGPK